MGAYHYQQDTSFMRKIPNSDKNFLANIRNMTKNFYNQEHLPASFSQNDMYKKEDYLSLLTWVRLPSIPNKVMSLTGFAIRFLAINKVIPLNRSNCAQHFMSKNYETSKL